MNKFSFSANTFSVYKETSPSNLTVTTLKYVTTLNGLKKLVKCTRTRTKILLSQLVKDLSIKYFQVGALLNSRDRDRI